MNSSNIIKSFERHEESREDRQKLHLTDERRDVAMQIMDEKMDTMLLQTNSLQKLMQAQSIKQETMNVKLEMVEENVKAVKTQVQEALRTQ
jgi:hypothetical protein